jgi:predicted phage terminase large subunit-like protein
MTRDEYLARLPELASIDYERAERGLFHYFKAAWAEVLEPSTVLRGNWHQGLIAEYLTACHLRQIKRLIINIPPRNTKSIMASVCFPTWTWIKKPGERFMMASYSQSLSTKHSLDRRRLIESAWYQYAWADRFHLMGDANIKTEFENNARGHMVATSLGGTATGKGGNVLLIDDPHDPDRAASDVERQNDLDSFDQKFSTRLDDKETGVMIVIMQRLHAKDLSGHLLTEGGWEHLKIPAIEDEPRKVYVYPISKREKVRVEGEIMHPDRESSKVLDEMKVRLSSYGFAGQYQQRPAPREGGMLKRENWLFWQVLPGKFDEIVLSMDCSFKEKATSDFTVITAWGKDGMKKYLLGGYRKQVGFGEACRAVVSMLQQFPKARRVLIEDSANGPAIIETLSKQVSGITAVTASRSKTERVAAVEPDHEQKNYLLPLTSLYPWVQDFMDECSDFPNAPHDDYVDSFTQAAAYFLERGRNALDKLIAM